MGKKITKAIPVIAAVNEVAWYAQEKDNLGALSVKARWNLKKNIKELEGIATQYREFRNTLEDELRAKYSNDDMSTESEIDDGNGNMVPGRTVKDEYLDDFHKDTAEMQRKLDELLYDNEDVALYEIDMDAEVERMPDDAQISDAALDMLSLFDIEEDAD